MKDVVTIIACWILVLALVTALCLAASRGDAVSEAAAPGPGPRSQRPRAALDTASFEAVQADPEAAAAVIAAVRARREHPAPVARVGSAVG